MTTFTSETSSTAYIPTVGNLLTALPTWRYGHDGTNVTDRMGMIGVAMVFPEFVPNASEVQMLITLAHGIDHIYDEGADHQRIVGGPTNLEHFVNLQKLFQERFHKNSDLYASTLGFLAQVVTVEGAAHSGYYEKPRELKIYRELINALYARMVVSFGSSLVLPKLKVDRIGEDAADFDPDKLPTT